MKNMTKRDIAWYLNIDRSTLYNWKKNKPNLYKTIMLGLKAKEIIQNLQTNIDDFKKMENEQLTNSCTNN